MLPRFIKALPVFTKIHGIKKARRKNKLQKSKLPETFWLYKREGV